MSEDDPAKKHPGREDSWKPAPRKRMLGVALASLRPAPPETRVTDTGAATKQPPSHTGRNVTIGTGALITIVMGLWQGLPAVLQAGKAPEQVEQTMATQAALDATQAQVHLQARQIEKLGELVCAINEGSAGTDWPCSPQDYRPARNPPPKIETDRSYPLR